MKQSGISNALGIGLSVFTFLTLRDSPKFSKEHWHILKIKSIFNLFIKKVSFVSFALVFLFFFFNRPICHSEDKSVNHERFTTTERTFLVLRLKSQSSLGDRDIPVTSIKGKKQTI